MYIRVKHVSRLAFRNLRKPFMTRRELNWLRLKMRCFRLFDIFELEFAWLPALVDLQVDHILRHDSATLPAALRHWWQL